MVGSHENNFLAAKVLDDTEDAVEASEFFEGDNTFIAGAAVSN